MKPGLKNHYWLKSGFLTMLQNIAVVFFGFSSFYILVRVLDKSSFGAWALFIATTSIMEVIRNGLIQNGLIKFLSFSEKENHSKIISASFTINAVLSLTCLILIFLFADFLSNVWEFPQLTRMFYIYSLAYILTGILAQFQFVQQANLRFTGIFLSVLIRQGTFFVFILTCYIMRIEFQLISLVYMQIVSAFFGMTIIYLYARKNISFSFDSHLYWIKKLFNFGKYAFGTSVSSMLFNSISQLMLGGLLSTSAAGVYNIALRITNLVEIPTSSVASIVFPQSARRMETDGKQAVKYLYEKSVGAILALLIPILFFIFLFSDFVINIIAGKNYSEATSILQITILYCLLIPYGRQFGTLLDSIGKPKLTFSIVLLCACMNTAFNYILINRLGVIGAAYGTLLANSIGFIIGQIILRKELGVNFFNTLIYAKNFYFDFFNKYLRSSLVKIFPGRF